MSLFIKELIKRIIGFFRSLFLNDKEKKVIHYRGNEILILEKDSSGFGPGAIVNFDMDNVGDYEYKVKTDENGIYSISIDASTLSANGTIKMFVQSPDGSRKTDITILKPIQDTQENPANEVPVNLLPANSQPPEPYICLCIDCPPNLTLLGNSLEAFTNSYTPVEYGIELATGKLRQDFPILSFNTRRLGFNFTLYHTSLVEYSGAVGNSFSHSFI